MAIYTPNLQLEKPLGTEHYDIAVHNSNSDKIEGMYNDLWKIRAKLIGNDTTYTDLNTIYAAGFYRSASVNNLFNNLPPGCTASFNLIVENISDNNRYGKQWIGDHIDNEFWHRTNTSFTIDTPTWTAWEKVITTADVINNLISTSATLPLSAGQGKILNDTKANGTTQVIAGSGLTGGGDLSANRTINVVSANAGITVNADNIELKPATTSIIGGVKPDGTTTSVDVNGVISTVNRASTSTQIIAGLGLTGGGTLIDDIALNIVSANDGIIANADNIQLNTIDNLTTASSTKPLSANMGKQLQDTKLNLTGGTVTNGTNEVMLGVTYNNLSTDMMYLYSSTVGQGLYSMMPGFNEISVIRRDKRTGVVAYAGGNYGTINGSTATFSGNVTAPSITIGGYVVTIV